MKQLRCKECGEDYEGDSTDARICDTCYEDYSVGRQYTDEEINDQFAPTDDEIAAAEGDADGMVGLEE